MTGTLVGLGGFVSVQVRHWRGLALFALLIAFLAAFAAALLRVATGKPP